MDNLCHTLVGAAMGEAGLKHRTRYGNATLMLAANLPDLDVLVFLTGIPIGVVPPRVDARGAGAVAVAGRISPPSWSSSIAGAGSAAALESPPVSVPWLLALSYLGICTRMCSSIS